VKQLLLGLVVLVFVLGALGSSEAGDALAALIGIGLLLLLVALVAYIGLFSWIGRDAKARGLHETASWLSYVRSQGLLGFLIYLLARPRGSKAPCPNCGHRFMASMRTCPFCGA
jgi:hypothetical protein